MDTLQALVLVDVYLLLALSLWTSFKGEIRSQFQYLLFALLGHVIAANVFPALGTDVTVWCSIAYLCSSAAVFAHKIPNLPKEKTGFVSSSEISRGKSEDAGISDIDYGDVIQKAQDILKEL